MPNKLKRSTRVKDASCQRKGRAPFVWIVLSDDEASPGDSNEKYGSNAAERDRQTQPVKEERKVQCAKIAPVFLQAAQPRKCKRSSDGDEPVVKLSFLGDDVKEDQLPASSLHSCLQEIQKCNPTFPVPAVFSCLQRKASDVLQQFESTAESSTQNHFKEKRKRGDELPQRMCKRLRYSVTTEGVAGFTSAQDVQEMSVISAKKQPRCSKLSRTHRLRQQSLMNNCELSPERESVKNSERVSFCEDTLWTDKYSPQLSSEVIGNPASVNKLHSWLKTWKIRAVCDERRQVEEQQQEENSNGSWDCGDFQGEAGSEDGGGEPLCNTVLITGPSGVGKSAAVYACAQELGFKVFEVNCSSQRSGRHVLSQLKEATQSHLVETSGKESLKPAYFNNYSTNSCMKSESLPGKAVLPKSVSSTSKMRAARTSGRSGRKGKAKPATVTLAHFFKAKAKADLFHFGGLPLSVTPGSQQGGDTTAGSDQTALKDKKTATSLILFEEVDVIFKDDVGFLAAVKAFMSTTKRPVILTTNDPFFKERFDCSLEEIVFKEPSAVNACSYLQLVCLAEKVRLDSDDIRRLVKLHYGDIRRSLLQLQLWVHGSGRKTSQGGALSRNPVCAAGCSADMLGLHTLTPNHVLNILKRQSWSERDMNELLNLLSESWRRGVPLLYSNLGLLLSKEAKGDPVRNLDQVTDPGLQSESCNPHTHQLNQNNPRVLNKKSIKNISRLSRRKCNTTVDSTSSTSSTCAKAAGASEKTKHTADKVVTDCLAVLADFFDLMSFVDATLPPKSSLVSGSCTSEAFMWTGAALKDGLLDEMSEEEGKSWRQEAVFDIQAAVEGLGCHRCWWRVSEVWTKAQNSRKEQEEESWTRLLDRLGLTASPERRSLHFTFPPLCAPSVSQRRYKLSRAVLSSKPFSLLGNRQAVSVDYMPVLRSICRSHEAQQQDKESVRCLTHFHRVHLGLSKSMLQLLAEDFT
ncbi:ATPase family AAA domain-containing protein 5b [Parambassis ranga]|uniref:ATPase family AAA domain-containing protein 5b n=1 Tax=Parambassis ranga TaxID=210632 RepID=A0A6P7KCJ3_9TELE|nr:ATPase family AAA domain-containing protein 5-like [Parambassis ranga]